MKAFFSFLIMAIGMCIFSSCTKTNNVSTTIHDSTTVIIRDTIVKRDTIVVINPKNPITGLWTGIYKLNGAPAIDSFSYTFMINADKTIYTIGNGTNGTAGYSTGPWALNGTAFSATLTNLNGVAPVNVQTITATYDSVGGYMTNGVFTDIAGSVHDAGTFYMKRIQ